MSDTIQKEVIVLFVQQVQQLTISDMESCEYFGIVNE